MATMEEDFLAGDDLDEILRLIDLDEDVQRCFEEATENVSMYVRK